MHEINNFIVLYFIGRRYLNPGIWKNQSGNPGTKNYHRDCIPYLHSLKTQRSLSQSGLSHIISEFYKE